MAWDHGIVESLDYAEAPRSRAMPPVEPAFDSKRALTGRVCVCVLLGIAQIMYRATQATHTHAQETKTKLNPEPCWIAARKKKPP